MDINIKHITTNEIKLSLDGIKEQINWNMAHKNFALVVALQAGARELEAELDARYFPKVEYV